MSEEVGRHIGNGLGKVVEVDLKDFSSYQARFLRVRVEFPLEKPLRRGGVIASPEGDKVCIGFKYERLVGLCFKCGWIGHEARYCSFHDDHQHELPYGEWLKAKFIKPILLQTMVAILKVRRLTLKWGQVEEVCLCRLLRRM